MSRPVDVGELAVVKIATQKHGTIMWTTSELGILSENARLGVAAIALLLGRSEWSVRNQARRCRISLRRAGETRGLVLGQPRGQAIMPQIREDVVSGKVGADAIARRMALSRDAALCPVCARRPAEVASSGYCICCHKRLLSEAHLAELEKIDATRSLWASRQALCRARKAHVREG